MTLNQIFNDITILINDSCVEPYLPIGIGLALLFVVLGIIVYRIEKPKKRSKKSLSTRLATFLLIFIGITTLITVIILVNYDANVYVKLYASTDEIDINELSKYFIVSDMSEIDDKYHFSLTPLKDYHSETCRILRSMGKLN